MTIEARVIEDSISPCGVRLTTMQLTYPRMVHSEFLTHRQFSRNASSSRAIPVKRILQNIRNNPAMTIHWGANQPGMQAHTELTGVRKALVKGLWMGGMYVATSIAWVMDKLGAHKQVVNRITEPWAHITVIVSSTYWDNWDDLRDHDAAEPNIRVLARKMKLARFMSKPVLRSGDKESESGWHLPFVTIAERAQYRDQPLFLAKLSTARNARVSYLNHEGKLPVVEEDLALHERLVGSEPIHASPTEHAAFAADTPAGGSGNFRGWYQYRSIVESNINMKKLKELLK